MSILMNIVIPTIILTLLACAAGGLGYLVGSAGSGSRR
jgi:hypothetical protein